MTDHLWLSPRCCWPNMRSLGLEAEPRLPSNCCQSWRWSWWRLIMSRWKEARWVYMPLCFFFCSSQHQQCSYHKVPSFLQYGKLKKFMEFRKETEKHGISQKTWFLMPKITENTEKNHENKAKTNETKLHAPKIWMKPVRSVYACFSCHVFSIQCIVGYVYCTCVSLIKTL